MRKLVILVVLALLGGVALVGCGDDEDSSADKSDEDGGATVTTAVADEGTPVAIALGEVSEEEYTLTADPATVAAGAVSFKVTNPASNEKKHELVVMKTDTPADQLKPRANDPDKVEEEGDIEEIELEPGKSGTLTLDLEAGKYVLVCNIAKHYARGMFASFEVT